MRKSPIAAIACLLAMGVSACASSGPPSNREKPVDRAVAKTQEGLPDAALAPLEDLNLRRTPIPPRLEAIQSPYEPIHDRSCHGLASEIEELTAILGPDVDMPEPTEDADDKAADTAANVALGQVKATATDFIPYRSLVRLATGASEHERKLRAAYERGMQRRAFLKGVGGSLGCKPPAAPLPFPTNPSKVEYRGDRPR